MSVQVFVDGSEITSFVQTGSVTPRLNRPRQCTFRVYSEGATGTAISRAKVVINGELWFHGFVMQISTEAGEDGTLISEYTCLDPMMLWQWRPARSGPNSADPGDFSNPELFKEAYLGGQGPYILREILEQSEVEDDAEGEGNLFLEYGDFATGIANLKGAPTDYPMTIAEVFELLASTGTVDAILTPIDSGGNMAKIDVYNGDHGTDRTGSVYLDYATGNLNVKTVRMVEDSSNICTKLWYYLGPRVKLPTDPAGDQHWRANVTGSLDQPGGPGNPLNDVPYNDPSTDPPYMQNEILWRRAITAASAGVRMEIKIFDAQGDENPAAFKELYHRLWQMESWLRGIPRTLVHITPVRTSDNMQLPPGVNPVQVGDFDIGDLVTVTVGPIMRVPYGVEPLPGGGFTGAQRIYEYTVTWDEDGVIEMGELLTSADQEGFA